jgi:hypothetical protein
MLLARVGQSGGKERRGRRERGEGGGGWTDGQKCRQPGRQKKVTRVLTPLSRCQVLYFCTRKKWVKPPIISKKARPDLA